MKELPTMPTTTACTHEPPRASVPPSNTVNAAPTHRPSAPALRPTLLRRGIQCCFALFLAWVGWNFYCYVLWATGKSAVYTPKPPSVEGFLPISELMAARRLFVAGQWDSVHPAGLTLFLAIALMALLFRKGFCGYICPVGLAANLLGRLGQRLGISRNPPRRAALALQALKYVPLAFLCYFSLFGMSLPEIDAFLGAPFNMAADSSMLFFFLRPSVTALVIIGIIVAASLVVRNAWCRFLCPYGAFLGLIALLGPVAVKRNDEVCTGCRRCDRACPSAIAVHEKTRVNTPECLGCAACIDACPRKNCLEMTVAGRRVPFWITAAGCVAVLLGSYAWAVHTGHWTSQIPPAMLRRFHMLQFGG